MAVYTLAPNVKRQLLDNSGNPVSLGLLYTYLDGTSTPATTYQTSNGTAHENPIQLDSAGRIPGSGEIYLEPGTAQKWTFKTAAGVELWTQPGIGAVPPSAVNVDIQGTFGTSAAAGDLMYLSDGSGALTAGSWYKADADLTYGSLTPELGFAVNATSSGATGTLRQGGVITLTGLLPGTKYYASATAGSVTSTAPANARYVGQAQSTTELVISHDIADSSTDSVVIDPKIKNVCDGRLTLTTGVPVTTGDVTAATTLYFTPYQGNQIALYNGTRWQMFTFAQLSLAVPSTTSQMYDAFVDYNSGTPALTATAWTNDTTRATALTTQDGIYVLTGTLGKRYVGSFRTTGVSGQTEDSFAKRYVWNYYNRMPRLMRVLEATNSWTYTTAAYQQANASAANQLDLVLGVAEECVRVKVFASAASDQASGVVLSVGIGEDSATAVTSGTLFSTQNNPGADLRVIAQASLEKYPAVGRHFYAWLEYSTTLGTTTWFGDVAAIACQSGIYGEING